MKSIALHTAIPMPIDPLTAAKRQVAFWRACTSAALIALVGTAAVRHPALIVLLICLLALCALVGGGALLEAHRGDTEMGIAPREGDDEKP